MDSLPKPVQTPKPMILYLIVMDGQQEFFADSEFTLSATFLPTEVFSKLPMLLLLVSFILFNYLLIIIKVNKINTN